MTSSEPNLSRSLRNRHIQLIALGGTIGVGLFLGSAKAIHNAGPGLLLSYAVGGVAIIFIMHALGELLTYRPVAYVAPVWFGLLGLGYARCRPQQQTSRSIA